MKTRTTVQYKFITVTLDEQMRNKDVNICVQYT